MDFSGWFDQLDFAPWGGEGGGWSVSVLKGRGRLVAAADVEPDAHTEAVTLNLTL